MSFAVGNRVSAEIVLITPEMAAQWLDRNQSNRRIRRTSVESYARDILAGKWELNHQGIAFDSNGVLVDGQHRLSAIVEANKPVRMFVFKGVNARENIDLHIRRTMADILGETPAAVTIATYLGGRFSGNQRMTVSEVEDFIYRHREAIEFACEVLNTSRKGLRSAAIKAAIVCAYYYRDKADLKRFADTFLRGYCAYPQDIAAIRLRDLVVNISKHERNVFNSALTAIKHFCDGRVISRLYACKENPFPLKEENV